MDDFRENGSRTRMEGRKYKATLQYLGTRYAGWQVQKGHSTVQGVVENALLRLAGQAVAVVGAGRTDAGVHALGQVAHFRFPHRDSVPDLLKSLNALLPWDIRAVRLERTDDGFHASRHARRKRYQYRIYNGDFLPPFEHLRACHVARPLDLERMADAAARFLGEHDNSGFAAASTRVRSKVRTIATSQILQRGSVILYRVEASGFLHHMVRNMVGTLLQAGLGDRPCEDVDRIFLSRDRGQAGPTAPAHGLYLVRVWY